MSKLFKNIIFRCDASQSVGYGHFSRCLSIAQCLKDFNWNVHFAMMNSSNASNQLKDMGISASNISLHKYSQKEESNWFKELALSIEASIIFLDIRSDLSAETIKELQKNGAIIVTIDDPSERRLFADLAFYPPVPQVKEMSWVGFNGVLYCGWEWVPLKNNILKARENKIKRKDGKNTSLLLTMGGSDPAGITIQVLNAIDSSKEQIIPNVIIGPEFMHANELNLFLSTAKKKYNIINGNFDIIETLSEADLAIISFGVTAYELASLGVPTIIISLSDDHAKSASVFDAESMSISLGNFKDVDNKMISNSLSYLLGNKKELKKMKEKNLKNSDAKGSSRIANVINNFFDSKRTT